MTNRTDRNGNNHDSNQIFSPDQMAQHYCLSTNRSDQLSDHMSYSHKYTKRTSVDESGVCLRVTSI